MTIDLFGHLRLYVPTLKETAITFYGPFGYFAFIILCIMGLLGTIWMIVLLNNATNRLIKERKENENKS